MKDVKVCWNCDQMRQWIVSKESKYLIKVAAERACVKREMCLCPNIQIWACLLFVFH